MSASLIPSEVTARVHDDPEAFQRLEGEWRSLFHRHGGWNLFLSWPWFSQWWLAFGADKQLRLLTLSQQGRLVGIAPMMVEPTGDGACQLALIGSDRTTDYGDVLAEPAHLPALCDALADFVQAGLPGWKGVEFRSLRAESPLLGIFREALRRRGLNPIVEQSNSCPTAHLAPSWDEFLATLDKTHRHELRRKIRRSQAVGEQTLHSFRSPEEVGVALDSFIRLHRASRTDKAEFLDEEMASFFRGMSHAFAEEGWLSLNFMRIDGRDVAATLSFSNGDRVLLYNSGLDPDYRRYSVGIALHAADIRQAIEEGKEWYDFLRGTEPYKYDLGGKDSPIFNLVIRRDGGHGGDVLEGQEQ